MSKKSTERRPRVKVRGEDVFNKEGDGHWVQGETIEVYCRSTGLLYCREKHERKKNADEGVGRGRGGEAVGVS